MNKSLKAYFSWFLVVIWMIAIFMFSSQNSTESGDLSVGLTERILSFVGVSELEANSIAQQIDFFVRKTAHFTVYMILGIFTINSLSLSGFTNRFSASLLICFLYSISDEIHQMFVPGRACRVFDIFIDTTGASFGIVIYLVFFLLRNKIKSNMN